MYQVRTLSPLGYLFRGRVVKSEANATAYSSPSAARRAEASAVAAGICTKTEIIEIKKWLALNHPD